MTDTFADLRATRLTQHDDLTACFFEPFFQKPDLRGLPTAFGAFEG